MKNISIKNFFVFGLACLLTLSGQLYAQKFGYIDSKGSGYFDLSANFEVIPSWTVTPHVGRQTVNYTVQGLNASYNDMSLTVTKDFGKGLTTSLSYHGTNAEPSIYSSSFDNKYLGERGAVLGMKYNF
jgi:uncharacterized protein (TIGR02001 family)